MTAANRRPLPLLFWQKCLNTGESYSINSVRALDENSSVDGIRLHGESKIGLDVEYNSMDGVKLHDESKLGLDVEYNSMDGVKLHNELKLGLDAECNLIDCVKLHDEFKLGLDAECNSMNGVKLFDELMLGLDDEYNVIDGVKLHDELMLGLDEEWLNKSPGQDSSECNLSYDGSEQHLYEGLEQNSGAVERKELLDRALLELEDGLDKDDSSLTMLGEEDEVQSSFSNWENPLCVPQDNLFGVFDTYPSFLDNRIPTEALFHYNVVHNSRIRLSVDGRTTLDNPINVSKTCEIKNMRHDNLPFKVYKKRRSSKQMKRKRMIRVIEDFCRENIYVMKNRHCSHCKSEKTPQWREGPLGPKTLCNACGVRYKKGRLVPEYRPLASPTFDPNKHSNRDRKIVRRLIPVMC